jgi:hypothetical protein
MADVGNEIAGMGVNMGVGRGLDALGMRSPIPLPNFYNPNSPDHFRDSEAGRLLHGDRNAMRHYGFRSGGRLLGAGIGGAAGGPLGAWLGGMLGGWIGNRIAGPDQPEHLPVGTVTVGDINDTSSLGGPADHVVFDPWTGTTATIPNFSDYNPNFTGGAGYSAQGPYSGGYQGLPDDGTGGPQQGPTLPNFDMGDQYSGVRDANGNPTWDPSADQNGDGRLTPNERREASDWQLHGPSAFGSGVTNFMVGGFPVITGYRPAGGDMNQMATYNGRDWGG